MGIIEVVTIISIIIAVVFAVMTFRLMKRVETMEDYISDLEKSNDEYFNFFSKLKTHVTDSYSHLRNIDRLGSFQSDDETGFIFNELKNIIEALKRGF